MSSPTWRLAAALPLLLLAACWAGSPDALEPGHGPPATPAARPDKARVVVVYAGHEVWIGNDEYETDPAARYEGALGGLKAAFAANPPAGALPPGSDLALVTYAQVAKPRAAFTPIDAFSPDAFGGQRDYHRVVGNELVDGVTLGLDMLRGAAATHRLVLVVIGDGTDTNGQASRPRVAKLAARAAREQVTIYAVVLPGALSDEREVASALTTNVQTVRSPADLTGALATIWAAARRP